MHDYLNMVKPSLYWLVISCNIVYYFLGGPHRYIRNWQENSQDVNAVKTAGHVKWSCSADQKLAIVG
jgi:hypothetical protein